MDNNELNLDQLLGREGDWNTPPEAPAEEIKQIRGILRRRSAFTIAVSVVLAAVLLAVTVFGVIPFAESFYWHPDDTTYLNRTDLQTTIYAFTELFQPGCELPFPTYQKTGFATWSLDIPVDSVDGRTIYSGTLEKNTLTINQQFTNLHNQRGGLWVRCRDTAYTPNPESIAETTALLQSLPSYIKLEAAVTFTEDLSMEELWEFHERWNQHWPDLNIAWVAIRSFEPDGEWTPDCGMNPAFHGGALYNGLFTDYPHFNLGSADQPRQLEQHFKSRLQYSADRVKAGRGIIPDNNPNLYQEILDYVNENGVYTYGCLVYASPEVLLEMMEDSDVCYIYLSDGWIDVN